MVLPSRGRLIDAVHSGREIDYVGTYGFGKIMRLHLRGGTHWWWRSACFRGASGPLRQKDVEKETGPGSDDQEG
ncbi:hypothetical protein SPHFLASMR4Y_03016 [Sphingorhabdus sp. SMR4y]|nr:hypothetical protein SPHFLASMR4Y_03016 [Sphingorhabdus sp. SMR4y]